MSHQHRRAFLLGDHDVAQIVEGANLPDAANDEALFPADEEAASRVGIVGLDSLDDLLQSEIEAHELCGIEDDLELERLTPEARNVGHPADLAKGRGHDPGLKFLQLTLALSA